MKRTKRKRRKSENRNTKIKPTSPVENLRNIKF